MTNNPKLKAVIERSGIILGLAVLGFVIYLVFSTSHPNNPQLTSFCKPTGVINGTDVVKAYVDKTSKYSVWLRVETPLQINFNDLPDLYNPLLVNVDNKNCYEISGNGPIDLNTWTWVNTLNGSDANNFRVNLSKGTHIIAVTGSYSSIDHLELVNTYCVPVSTGSNCLPSTPNVEISPDDD